MPVPEGTLPSASDTLLFITGMGGFQYQARGLTQSLSVIQHAKQQLRTVNGVLRDISNPLFRKYASKITCSDVDAPPLDNIWPGMILTVNCAASLCYQTGNTGSPFKPVVSGSMYTQGHMTFYRPVLTMMVTDPKQDFEEWKHNNGWELGLEEV